MVVDLVDLLPAFPQLQARLKDLYPEVVFLVYHGGERLAGDGDHAAGPRAACVLATDEVPFDQQVLLDR